MIPLTRPLRLRTTAQWPGFREIVAIPIPYGRVRYTPVQADETRTLWALADGQIDQIVGVEVAGKDYANSRVEVRADATGAAVTYLVTGTPVKESESIAVDAIGRLDSETGEVIENPADWLYDVLANIQGAQITRSDLAEFRSQCATVGIRIGGLLDNLQDAAQSVIRDVLCHSCGAVWSQAMTGFATLYPRPSDLPDAVVATSLSAAEISGFSASADARNLATVVRLAYDYDYAESEHRGAVEVEALQATDRWGRLVREVSAGWIKDQAQAVALASRLCAHYSRPQWQLSGRVRLSAPILRGDTIMLTHPYSPVAGNLFVLDAARDMAGSALALRLEGTDAEALSITTRVLATRLGALADDEAVTVQDGDTYVLSGLDPLSLVSVDGTEIGKANADGEIEFPITQGDHVATITPPGGTAYTYEFTV